MFLHNPNAGPDHHSKGSLMTSLRLAGLSVGYRSTRKGFDLGRLLERQPDLLVVAGGDGTVSKAIKQLPDRRIPIAILPLGSANNIARSLGISGQPHELAESWHIERWRPFSIGRARGPWGERRFVEAVGVGPIAALMGKKVGAELTGARNIRKGRLTLQKVFRKAAPLDLDIRVDGRRLRGDMIAFEVLNVAYTGPSLRLAASADPGDGNLEVVTIPTLARAEMIEWLDAPQRTPPPTEVMRGRQVTIVGDLPVHRVDDEAMTPVDGATIEVALEREPAVILAPLVLDAACSPLIHQPAVLRRGMRHGG